MPLRFGNGLALSYKKCQTNEYGFSIALPCGETFSILSVRVRTDPLLVIAISGGAIESVVLRIPAAKLEVEIL